MRDSTIIQAILVADPRKVVRRFLVVLCRASPSAAGHENSIRECNSRVYRQQSDRESMLFQLFAEQSAIVEQRDGAEI